DTSFPTVERPHSSTASAGRQRPLFADSHWAGGKRKVKAAGTAAPTRQLADPSSGPCLEVSRAFKRLPRPHQAGRVATGLSGSCADTVFRQAPDAECGIGTSGPTVNGPRHGRNPRQAQIKEGCVGSAYPGFPDGAVNGTAGTWRCRAASLHAR